MDTASNLEAAFSATASVLVFRAFPFFAYLSVCPQSSQRARLASAGAYVVLSAVASRAGFAALPVILAFLYCLSTGLLLRSLFGRSARTALRKLLLFVASAGLFLFIPAALMSRALVPSSLAMVLGWEAMLKTYSYCVEVARGRKASLAEYVFCTFVDPTLVYRGAAEEVAVPKVELAALRRIALGVALFFAGNYLTGPEALQTRFADGRALNAADVALDFLKLYWLHAGLAGVQIGLMRVCGKDVPERYRRPWIAVSPLDFWRRWNTYMGDWARRYLFQPSSRLIERVRPAAAPRRLTSALGALVTFTCVGALHDLSRDLGSSTLDLSATSFFASMGVLALAWEAGARFARKSPARRLPWWIGASVTRALGLGLIFWLGHWWMYTAQG